MSSPILYKAVYLTTGVALAGGVPAGAAYLAYAYTGSVAVTGVVAAAVVYQLMAMSVAMLALSSYLPDGVPLGPSYMAGYGILTLLMTVVPLVALPGMAWLYVLLFDEQGHLGGDVLSFEPENVQAPNHGDAA